MPSWREGKGRRERARTIRVLTVSVLLAALCLGSAGCALFAPRHELPLRVATVDELTDLLKAREGALRTVKGLFTAQVKGPGVLIAHTVYGAVFYRRAEALRLQGSSRLSGALFDFMLEPGRYLLKLPQEGKLISGFPGELAEREEISEPLKLSVLAMSGLIGIQSLAPGEWAVMSEDEERYRVDVYASHATAQFDSPLRRIWFERQSFQVVREERLTPAGEIEGTLELEDFRQVGEAGESKGVASGQPTPAQALVLPFSITAESGQGRGRVRIEFKELVANVPLRDQELKVALLSNGQVKGSGCEAAGC